MQLPGEKCSRCRAADQRGLRGRTCSPQQLERMRSRPFPPFVRAIRFPLTFIAVVLVRRIDLALLGHDPLRSATTLLRLLCHTQSSAMSLSFARG